jgi:BolA protein
LNVPELIRERLSALAPESISIEDESARHVGHAGAAGGGGHYRVVLVSQRFAGQPLQARHRMVYEALGPLMHREIHALTISAYAPGETPANSQNEETR